MRGGLSVLNYSWGLNERGLSVLGVYLSWVYVSLGSKWRGLSVQESKCSGPKFLGSKCFWGLNVWEPLGYVRTKENVNHFGRTFQAILGQEFDN